MSSTGWEKCYRKMHDNNRNVANTLLWSLNILFILPTVSVSGVKVVSFQAETLFFWLSDPIVPLQVTKSIVWSFRFWRTYLSPAEAQRRKALSLLFYNGDKRTRRYFQENLVLVIRWSLVIMWPGPDSQVLIAAVFTCLLGGGPLKIPSNWYLSVTQK